MTTGETKMARRGDRMANWQLFVFCLPAVALSLTLYPLTVILPSHYNSQQGVPMAAIGAILFVSRIFDAVIDPGIGFLSDRTRGRLGARKPWTILGGAVAMLAVYFLFRPGPGDGAMYFTLWSMVAYLGWSLIQIPYLSWTVEVTRDYEERSRIVTYQRMLAVFGPVAFLAIPYLGITSSRQIGQETLDIAAWIGVAAFPICIGASVLFVPSGPTLAVKAVDAQSLWSTAARNAPAQRFFVVASLGYLIRGISDTLFFIFLTDFLGVDKQFSALALMQLFILLAAMRMWLPLINKLGKHRAWAWSKAVSIAASFAYFLFTPGQAPPSLVFALLALLALVSSAQVTIPGALLGDVIDYDTLKTGSNKAGNYFAILGLLEKFGVALGGGAAFLLLGAFGYEVGKPHDATANFGMLVVFVLLPAVAGAISVPLLWNFPLNRRRHDIVVRRLRLRAARAEARALAE